MLGRSHFLPLTTASVFVVFSHILKVSIQAAQHSFSPDLKNGTHLNGALKIELEITTIQNFDLLIKIDLFKMADIS